MKYKNRSIHKPKYKCKWGYVRITVSRVFRLWCLTQAKAGLWGPEKRRQTPLSKPLVCSPAPRLSPLSSAGRQMLHQSVTVVCHHQQGIHKCTGTKLYMRIHMYMYYCSKLNCTSYMYVFIITYTLKYNVCTSWSQVYMYTV